MIIGIPRELDAGETRVPVIPDSVKRFTDQGAEVQIEAGMGQSVRIEDSAYEKAGATIVTDRTALLNNADIVLRLRKPSIEEVSQLKKGSIHISFLDPFNENELVDAFAAAGVTSISMEMIPRTTRAQKMDALSSQASLAGYAMVVLAAERLDKILPMMMTPAGTISPSRVFIIGAGVAGLQAIATAKRMGARVDAFDTRPVVKEQVESLGGKFVEIDLGETGQTAGGYANALTPEQVQMQLDGQKKVCAQSDIVITTAQLFGRPAPTVVTKEMLQAMKPGSVVVDLAVESGGNVEGSVAGEEVEIDGVKVIGLANMPGRVANNASQMYSANLHNLVLEYWNKETKQFDLDMEDEIIKGCVITHDGEMVNEMIKNIRGAK
ncbi:MAG: Re/Si-specific NAD(P)(+) transhydrogenase subunit alpha [Oceanicoccus sp.]|uniref:Re/Si-specific NAD(P)(+) transhydrogenase subunit alpha n=1 Tax=Oceanicoccus sp. TaxID=2691044 RepID=UPI0026321301|nr:Re/Si-specific NAD(P)(+) transhydrogenase subunit alpha [Oceanicoccus sp.]MCP3908647.1 Re/Si-specific NAD(P)(+) transhydrogenase subunit alpha [Oceanicoccus sp.]MDG1772773.1 Re/Si-specific NAD(P)(+) transhydrogenase subunit alpha [Oceanicoccus sp.]